MNIRVKFLIKCGIGGMATGTMHFSRCRNGTTIHYKVTSEREYMAEMNVHCLFFARDSHSAARSSDVTMCNIVKNGSTRILVVGIPRSLYVHCKPNTECLWHPHTANRIAKKNA